MARVAFDVSLTDPSVEFEGCTVRKIEYEHTATTKRVCIELDTREVPEGPDIILPEGTWTVVDRQDDARAGAVLPIVGEFATKSEAEAAIVGLEYLVPTAVKEGRFGIDSPEE
jgi:hypothetical protein